MQTDITLKQNTARLSIFAITFLLLLKLIVGFDTGTVSIMSESIHSAVDLLASLIAFYIIRQSSGSPDAKHHYGHGKYENVSGALEAILIISAGLWIIYEAVDKWQNHSSPESLESGMIVMLVSVTINYLISQRMLTVAKQTK